MNIRYKHLPNTDGIYAVYVNGDCLGEVRKVYTGRTATRWIIAPDGFAARATTRLAYDTRKQATAALIDYCRTGKRSLVEG